MTRYFGKLSNAERTMPPPERHRTAKKEEKKKEGGEPRQVNPTQSLDSVMGEGVEGVSWMLLDAEGESVSVGIRARLLALW